MSRQTLGARRRFVTVAAAVGSATVLAGCGSVQLSAQAPPTLPKATATPVADAEPAMVMITLADRGYRATDIDVTLGQPVMFMVVNRGARSHELHAAVPVSSVQVDDPLATSAQAATYLSKSLDVTVLAGHEIDVTFVPSLAGTFAMSDGQVAAGAIVVD